MYLKFPVILGTLEDSIIMIVNHIWLRKFGKAIHKTTNCINDISIFPSIELCILLPVFLSSYQFIKNICIWSIYTFIYFSNLYPMSRVAIMFTLYTLFTWTLKSKKKNVHICSLFILKKNVHCEHGNIKNALFCLL